MAGEPTTGELFKGGVIVEADLAAAVDAFMTDRGTGKFPVGAGYTLDLAAAVQASDFAVRMLGDSAFRNSSKRAAVRTAILLARPVKR